MKNTDKENKLLFCILIPLSILHNYASRVFFYLVIMFWLAAFAFQRPVTLGDSGDDFSELVNKEKNPT